MDYFDLGNFLFEVFGGVFLCLNVRRLIRDKHVAGVSVIPTMFYTAWGLWNCVYYPALGQWLSVMGGVLTTGANGVWLYLYFYYRVRHKMIEGT